MDSDVPVTFRNRSGQSRAKRGPENRPPDLESQEPAPAATGNGLKGICALAGADPEQIVQPRVGIKIDYRSLRTAPDELQRRAEAALKAWLPTLKPLDQQSVTRRLRNEVFNPRAQAERRLKKRLG